MSDFPASAQQITDLHLSSASVLYGPNARAIGGAGALPASGTWVANVAVYIPFSLPFSYPVFRVWWMNGSTITTTNVDMGIYTADGTRLYSTGSTAMAGASSVQYVTLGTPFVLYPGRYYLAWTCSGTTNRSFAQSFSVAVAVRSGLLQQATALPLPATATFAAFTQNVLMPYCGITRTASGF